MEDRMSNTEFIVWVCEHKNPLTQMMLLEAIRKYAREVLEHKEEILLAEERAPMRSLIAPEAWICAAQDWLTALDERD